MYNEDKEELQDTLRGLMDNYNELRDDTSLNFKSEDMVVFLICDGFDRITDDFKQFAKDKGLFNWDFIKEAGYMKENRQGNWVMKDMLDIIEKPNKMATNLVHLGMVSTWDFGHKEDHLKRRRINFIFGIKQRNDGKINSHRWFYQGICEYLKPELCLMLDIGTRPGEHSIYKLFKYM